jgi:biotin operon repressor
MTSRAANLRAKIARYRIEEPTSASARTARTLLDGGTINTEELAREYGVTHQALALVIKDFRDAGYEVLSNRDGLPWHEYQLVDPNQAPKEDEMSICRVCGKPFTEKYVYTHERRMHNYRGGKTGKVRRNPSETPVGEVIDFRPPSTQTAAPLISPNGATKQAFTALPFVVLEDQDGALWIAEKIRDA